MTSPTSGDRLLRLERRRRRAELALARHVKREDAAHVNLEFRLGALVSLAGGDALEAQELDEWIGRTARRRPDLAISEPDLHRRGELRLAEHAGAGDTTDSPVGPPGSPDHPLRATRRIARGALIVAAGLGELRPTVLLGLLLSTRPDTLPTRAGPDAIGCPAPSGTAPSDPIPRVGETR